MMVAEQIEALSRRAHGPDVQVVPFRPDMPAVLAGARAVVAMAGYNTVAEVLASGAPALLVPRTFPREEQRNRARRLAEQGSIRMLEPAQLDPSRLRGE